MKRNLWFRMYASILDPEDKSHELTDKQFRAWIRLLCVYTRNNGVFPDERALARCLQVSLSGLHEILECLCDFQLIDRVEGGLAPHNWDTRQFESDSSTERVRAFRKRSEKRSGNVPGNDIGTPSENREQRTENIPPVVPQGTFELSAEASAEATAYEKARDAIWEFWDPSKRHFTKAGMLAFLKKTIKANGHTEQALADYVAAARKYRESAGEFAFRFDRYAKLAVDGPVAAPLQKQLPPQRVEPVRQIYREEPRRGPAPPCMDFNTILADRLGRK